MPAADVSQAQLRARSWWSGPDIYVVVDDYDLVAGADRQPAGPAANSCRMPRISVCMYSSIAAARRGAAQRRRRALFEPLLAAARPRLHGLMMSGRPDDGVLLGRGRPAPLPPGRGVLVTRAGDEQLVQVAWSPTAMSAHRAVIEAGPGRSADYVVVQSEVGDRYAAAALDAIDDPVALVDERPVAVDSLWSAALRSLVSGHCTATV